MREGDTAIVVRSVPMGVGSLFTLRPGDEVVLRQVGERYCSVAFFGMTFVVPRSCLTLGTSTTDQPAPADDDDPGELPDDWWQV